MTQETLQYIILAIFIFAGMLVFQRITGTIKKHIHKSQDPWNGIYENEEGDEDFDEIFITEENKHIDPEDPFHRENLKKFLRIRNMRVGPQQKRRD